VKEQLRARPGFVAVLVLLLAALPAVAQQRAMVPVTIDGETVRLATITYTPPGGGPFPILIFHHGSTGRGTDPSLFARPYEPSPLVRWFVDRGFAVVLPSRRGRGGSEGRYDEGFEIERARGYSCEPTLSLPGADRALRDIDAITEAILAQPFADRSRFVVGGQSRGGILAIAWSGRRPDLAKAAINFVGGWMGSGCQTAGTINTSLFNRGAAFGKPTLWLYGDKDPFYPLSHSRSNFAAFQAAGGKGSFHDYVPTSGNGHGISYTPDLWAGTVETYLGERGLPAKR
jgi:dienelactone hydrolase